METSERHQTNISCQNVFHLLDSTVSNSSFGHNGDTTFQTTSRPNQESRGGMASGLAQAFVGAAMARLNRRDRESEGSDDSYGVRDFKWRNQLEEVLQYKENCDKLIAQGKFNEAYGILNGIDRYANSVRDLKFLFEYSVSLMSTGRKEEAEKVFQELVDIIRDKLNSNDREVMVLAEKHIEKEMYISATILCLVAEKLSDKSVRTPLAAAYQAKCLQHLRELAGKITDKSSAVLPLLKGFVLPASFRMLNHILSVPNDSDTIDEISGLKILTFHMIEVIQLHGRDFHGRAETIKRSLSHMEEVYGPDNAAKHKFYGSALHNLGTAYLHLSQVDKATEALKRAIDVFNQATDFDNDAEKSSDLFKSNEMLRLASSGYL